MFNRLSVDSGAALAQANGWGTHSLDDSISHLALTAAPIDQQALADLGPRGHTDWIYFLVFVALVPFFDQRVLHLQTFALFTLSSVVVNLGTMFYLQDWALKVATNPNQTARVFAVCKCCQNLNLALMTGWIFLHFGINSLTSLATMGLMAFAQAAIITLRPNLKIMRMTLSCCLCPAVMVSAWIGGRAGLGTALILSIEFVFLWLQGARENRDYLHALVQNRELMLARRKANQEGARIGDALLSNSARHTAIMAERNRIAFEWHDTLLAGLSAVSWQLDEAKRRQREAPERAEETIDQARNMIQHYRDEARLAIADLLYDETEDENLQELLEKELPKLVAASTVHLNIERVGEKSPLAPSASRQLLRICQEAAKNSIRHGNPDAISVRLDYGWKQLTIKISDDGCGFEEDEVPAGHFGLQIMRQRARRLGADLEITSSPGSGTTVAIKVPYSTDFTMTPTRILIVEDQCFSRLALHTVIDSHPDMSIVCETDTGAAGVEAFREHAPDVTVVDLKLPDLSGIEVIKAIRRADPAARVVVLSNFDGSEYLHRAKDAGAMAYLTKDSSADELLTAIRTVRVGQSFIPPSLLPLLESRVSGNDLTAREQSVLELLVLGWSNKQIGDHLGIAEKTVRIHMSSIFSKLKAANRTQAVLIALQRGFVDPQLSDREATKKPPTDVCDLGVA